MLEKNADHFITILCDVFIAFPSLIIAIAVIGVLGNGLQNIAVSVVIATWAWFVRVVRSYSVQEMGKDYILAARYFWVQYEESWSSDYLIPNILPLVSCVCFHWCRFFHYYGFQLCFPRTWPSLRHTGMGCHVK